MSDNNEKNKSKKKRKCKIMCSTCEFYDTLQDYCSQKEIEDCSKQVQKDFASCDSYLISADLVMF